MQALKESRYLSVYEMIKNHHFRFRQFASCKKQKPALLLYKAQCILALVGSISELLAFSRHGIDLHTRPEAISFCVSTQIFLMALGFFTR
jgi:hypothetical protein